MWIPAFAVFALGSLAVAQGEVRIGLIAWQTDYDTAVRRARELDRPLLVHFGENPG
jgi:hypothetical protein